MAISLRRSLFNGEEAVRILCFDAYFVGKPSTQGMSKTRAFSTISVFLMGSAARQCEAGVDKIPSVKVVSFSWLKKMHYLSGSYAQLTYFSSAVSWLRSILQSFHEAEHHDDQLNSCKKVCSR